MNKDIRVYLEDIISAMSHAEQFVVGMDYAQFANDLKTNFAVTRALEIVGEATKRLPMPFRDQHSHVRWKDMAGMRDVIIHGYDNVNLKIVWQVIKSDIPLIKAQIQAILDNST
ncbi:MAG: DUF86 domain-containing protein [Ardenticatenaceae bacterium]|nr:DUF86 domain-containing protein [Ardenticatenaceae bacterium]